MPRASEKTGLGGDFEAAQRYGAPYQGLLGCMSSSHHPEVLKPTCGEDCFLDIRDLHKRPDTTICSLRSLKISTNLNKIAKAAAISA